ncbi:MAG: hypothetical protein ABI828_04490 [Actinomycetota bacterium]
MTDRRAMGDLERALRGLGEQMAHPQAPGMAEAVGRELRTGSGRTAPRRVTWPRRRLLAVVVAGLLLLAGTAEAARLVIGAIAIDVLPGPPPSTVPETGPDLGSRVTMGAARTAVGFQVLVPQGMGEPDGVFVDGGRVTLVWRSGAELPRIAGTPWGLVIVELRGDAVIAVKEMTEGTAIDSVHVGSASGFFIAGPTDLLLAGGRRLSVPGDVVLWQRGAVTLRSESLLSKADALRLAASIS